MFGRIQWWWLTLHAIHVESLACYDVEVVGESYRQKELTRVVGGKRWKSAYYETRAFLVCEDDNPHDENAVAVFIKRRHVGYLSRELAVRHRRYLRSHGGVGKAVDCGAVIAGGWRRTRWFFFVIDEGTFGVRIDVPWLRSWN